MSNTMTKSSVELLTQEKPVLNVNAPLLRLEEIEDDGLERVRHFGWSAGVFLVCVPANLTRAM